MTRSRALSLALVTAVFSLPATAVTVRVENLYGSVTARVVARSDAKLLRESPVRPPREADTVVTRHGDLIVIEATPPDKARIDITVELPYGYQFQARTRDGAVKVEGLIRKAEVITDTGELHFTVPWEATRLSVLSQEKPKAFTAPKGFKFRERDYTLNEAKLRWLLEDRLPELKITYGRILVDAGAPAKLTLEEMSVPPDSPIKMPWQAPAILDEVVAMTKQAHRSRKRGKRKREKQPEPASESGTKPTIGETGLPKFSSAVRMVDFSAAVYDRAGHPITDLRGEDFEVYEDGEPQRVEFAGAEEMPFNLALVLDLSGSTRKDRAAMKEAAARFIDIARPQDRVAAYALANNLFQVVSRLTGNRAALKKMIERIPEVSGGSPLYDIIALSYAEEFRHLSGARNALIVISDGVDNRIHGENAPSEVSFKKLRAAADGMNMIVYPVFLDPFTKAPPPGWAKKAKSNMRALAQATGGRLFVAQSIRDLDPVYPLVADELRSMYTVAYYPKNQNFDAAWRNVEVRVKRPGARVRTRLGYYAK